MRTLLLVLALSAVEALSAANGRRHTTATTVTHIPIPATTVTDHTTATTVTTQPIPLKVHDATVWLQPGTFKLGTQLSVASLPFTLGLPNPTATVASHTIQLNFSTPLLLPLTIHVETLRKQSTIYLQQGSTWLPLSGHQHAPGIRTGTLTPRMLANHTRATMVCFITDYVTPLVVKYRTERSQSTTTAMTIATPVIVLLLFISLGACFCTPSEPYKSPKVRVDGLSEFGRGFFPTPKEPTPKPPGCLWD
jgi:hypothetical protein